MGLHSLEEFTGQSDTQGGTATGVSVADAQHLGESGGLLYSPPSEQKPDILKGFTKGLASTPQILGQFYSYLGHNMDPGASEEQIMEGNTFGHRLARLGIEMTENNKRYIAEKYPETPDIWEKIGQGVGGALPLAATLGIGMLTGVDEAALTALAAGGIAATTNISAFSALKEKGTPTISADLMSLIPASIAGGLTMLGFGNFLKAAGGPLEQLAKGAINGFTTMAAQSAGAGEAEHLMGINQGPIVDRMVQYAIDGTVGAILGGPLGVHQALMQHAKIEAAFKELGLTDEQSRLATKVLMSKMMGKGLDIAESKAGSKVKDEGRIVSLDRKGMPIDSFYISVNVEPQSDVEVARQTQGFKHVVMEPLDIQPKDNDKATAQEIRERYVGPRDKQLLRGMNLGEDIKTLVPDKTDRGAMFLATRSPEFIDALLKDPRKVCEQLQKDVWERSKTKEPFEFDNDRYESFLKQINRFKTEIERSGNLSDNMRDALKEGKQYYDEAGQVGLLFGTLREILENYHSNRLYEKEPLQVQGRTGLGQSTWHSLPRFYTDPFEAMAMGKVHKSIDYADLLMLHNQDMAFVNHNRQLADALADLKPVSLGNWINSNRLPDGWKQIGNLHKDVFARDSEGKVINDENNNPIMTRYIFATPEGIADGIKALVDSDKLREIPGVLTIQKLQGIAKTGLLSFSFFHHLTFVTQTLASANGWKTLSDFPDALRTNFMSKPWFRGQEMDMVEHTGTTSRTHEVQDILGDLNTGDDAISKVLRAPVAKQLVDLSKASTHFLFDEMQRFIKVMTYSKNVAKWSSENPNASVDELRAAKIGYAKATNAEFGGLNWEALGVTRTQQSMYRMLLLAPDWVGSMFLGTKYAFSDSGTAGSQARWTLASAVIGGLVAADALNYLRTDHHMWENKKGHHFEIEVAPDVYVSPVRGAPGELLKVLSDVVESGGLKGASRYGEGKLSPFLSAAVTGITGVNYYGGNIWKGKSALEQNVNGTWNIISHMLPMPIGASSSVSYAQREKEQTPLGWGLTATGLGRFSKSSKNTHKSFASSLESDLFKAEWFKPLEDK